MFSPINADAEIEAHQVLKAELGDDVVFSLSHEFGGIGLLERENAAIVNAALLGIAERTVDAMALSLARGGITAPLYVSQNDGTLMNLDRARQYPVATFASGSTNSMRGAAFLSGMEDCVVIDMGGVTTDIGVVSGGFPRQSTGDVALAGVRTSIRMPELLSLAVGGGSIVTPGGSSAGPESIGYGRVSKALILAARLSRLRMPALQLAGPTSATRQR